MADEDISNGVTVDTNQREDDEKVAERAKKMEELELEKNDSSETAEKVVQSQEADKAEISRLLHKFLSAKNDLDELISGVDTLNNVMGKKIENMGGIEFLIQAQAETDNRCKELEQKIDCFLARTKLKKTVEELEVLVAETEAETKNLINNNKLIDSRLNLLEERELSSMIDAMMGSNELKSMWSMCSLLAAFSIGAAAAAAANVYFAKLR